jgi:hypothetical protein
MDSLLGWKQTLNEWIISPAYDSAYTSFMRETNLNRGVAPCEILLWLRNKQKRQAQEELRLRLALADLQQYRADSLYHANQLSQNPPSPFDFAPLPFGISRRSFQKLWTQHHAQPLQPRGQDFLVPELTIENRPYTAVFFFENIDRLQRYELQSPFFDADELDATVRLIAEELARGFERTAGDCHHLYRISLFDIKQGTLAPFKVWLTPHYHALVGIGTYKNRYYAKAIVTRKGLLPITPPSTTDSSATADSSIQTP